MTFEDIDQLRAHYPGQSLYENGAGYIAVWNAETELWDWWGVGKNHQWEKTGSTEELEGDCEVLSRIPLP
jgi:hypothetical protein